MITSNSYPVKVPAFEGPLDLLLFLIRKHEIDIYDIPIESITRQYLATLFEMEDLQLEVAGEFFVMAATLMEIKSRTLLPKHIQATEAEDEDEEFDPRWELVHQLLEYQKFKQAAQGVKELAFVQSELFPRLVFGKQPLLPHEQPLRSIDRIDLWHTFNLVLRRLSEKLMVGQIQDESITVSDRMEYILERLDSGETLTFSGLFEDLSQTSIKMVVVTFLGILELVRLRKLNVWQETSFAEIYFSGPKIELETPPI